MTHMVRTANHFIPIDYLSKVTEETTSFGFAAAHADGKEVIVKRDNKHFDTASVDALQRHPNVRGNTTLLYLGKEGELHADDMQPFTILSANDKPILIAILDGKFSQYSEENSKHTDEFMCVHKEIIPRIQKLYKFLGNNIHALMKELEDPQYGRDFANFMDGPHGAITLLAAGGKIQTFGVAGDDRPVHHENWWTSDNLGFSSKSSGGFMDDIASAMGSSVDKPKVSDVNVEHNKVKPKTSVASTKPSETEVKKPVAINVASSKPVDGSGKTSAPAATANEVARQTGAGTNYNDPEAELTLKLGQFTDFKSKWNFVRKRVPHEMIRQDEIKGLTQITLLRKHANKIFLQDFAKQEGLSGLDALGFVSTDSSTSSVPSVSANQQSQKPKIHPKAAASPQPEKPKETPIEKPVETTPSETLPQVVSEPLPILSPSQRVNMKAFTERDDVKKAIDRTGRSIADPQHMARVEKNIQSLKEQLGNGVGIWDVAKWPFEIHLQHNQEDPGTGGQIRFWLAHELFKLKGELEAANELLNEVTSRHVEQPKLQQNTHTASMQALRPKPKLKLRA